jgi:hypothetical protein
VTITGKNPACSPVQLATGMPEFSEEYLAELITLMPPPPRGWVQAAVDLPKARAAIDELTLRASADEGARATILADLEEALRVAGVEPRPRLVESLLERLSGLD